MPIASASARVVAMVSSEVSGRVNHLAHAHGGHGVGEVHADELRFARLGDIAGDIFDGETRGVGGEDRASVRHAVELLEDLLLEFEAFGNGLDDEVAAGEPGEVGREGCAGHRRGGIIELELAELDGALDPPLAIEHGIASGVDRLVVDVADHDLVAGDDETLGDAAAHDSSAEDADLLYFIELHSQLRV